MKNNKENITQKLIDQYPKPGIPAESAWANMKLMLDQELPVTNVKPGPSGWDWIKAIKILSAVIVVSALMIGIYLYSNTPFSVVTEPVKYSKFDSASTITGTSAIRSSQISKTPLSRPYSHKADPAKITSDSATLDNATLDSAPLDSAALNNAFSHKSALDKINPDKPATIRATGKNKTLNSLSSKHTDTIQNTKIRRHSESSKGKPLLTGPAAIKTRTNTGKYRNNAINTTNLKESGKRDERLSFNDAIQQNKTNAPFLSTRKSFEPEQSSNTAYGNLKEGRDREATSPVGLVNTGTNALLSPKSQILAPVVLIRSPEIGSNNILATKLDHFIIKNQPAYHRTESAGAQKSGFNNVHFGLYLNPGVPFSGFDNYFLGTNATRFKGSSISNEFYKILFPGIWVSRTLSNRGELMFKIKPYNQQLGNPTQLDSSAAIRADTSGIVRTITTGLAKSSGFYLGIQYNQPIFKRWALGIGGGVQWQQKALLINKMNAPKGNMVTDNASWVSYTSKTDTTEYVRPYIFTTNLELLYTLHRFQFGAGISLPLSSMVTSPHKGLRPVNGQISIRWWIK